MDKKNKYDVDISEKVPSSFARFLLPEIRKFYESKAGQGYYAEWLKRHPEYEKQNPPKSNRIDHSGFSCFNTK